jgi:hypothetical protein
MDLDRVKGKMLFRVGFKLPSNRPEAMFSLSHVQNFLGDERGVGKSPFWQPLDVPF